MISKKHIFVILLLLFSVQLVVAKSNNCTVSDSGNIQNLSTSDLGKVKDAQNTTDPLPKTIRVYRTATGKIDVVDFKYYVKNVMDNEWGMPAWSQNTLKVGAMAVKNYGWYWTVHQKYPGLGYDVKDSTADQVYKPGSEQDYTNAAVEATWDYTMLKNGELFESEYDSGVEEGSAEPLYPGRLAMWGAVYYDKQGKDWQWILHNYYDPITIQNIGGTNDQAGPTPVANFKANVKSGTAPLSVKFTDISTGSPTSWNWSFGDKTYNTQKNPKHIYKKAGKYKVTLKVSNKAGSKSTTKIITVYKKLL